MRKFNTLNASIRLKEINDLRKEEYYKDPKRCKYCGKPIPFEKRAFNTFCSQSCGAYFNNKKGMDPRRGNPFPYCEACGKKLSTHGQRFCKACGFLAKTREKMILGEKILDTRIKKYLLLTREHKCEECENTEWIGKPIPLDVHHIDGNRKNNKLENLKLLCKNCHGLTGNYAFKNRQLLNTIATNILESD